MRVLLPVGVVMRSEAPLIERLLSEKEQANYAIAIDEPRMSKRWFFAVGTPVLVYLVSIMDIFRFTK